MPEENAVWKFTQLIIVGRVSVNNNTHLINRHVAVHPTSRVLHCGPVVAK